MNIVYVENIKPHHQAYLRSVFQSPEPGEPVRISKRHDIGKTFFALLEKSEKPRYGKTGTPFLLPDDANLNFNIYCYYLPKDRQKQFLSYIESYYNLDMLYFMYVSKQMRLINYDSAELFYTANGISPDTISCDAAVKKDYRKRSEIKKRIRSAIKSLTGQIIK